MSTAERMRKYRARKALRAAIQRALKNGMAATEIHIIMGTELDRLFANAERNADRRYGDQVPPASPPVPK